MKKSYDLTRAEKLVPLLEAITREMVDRSQTIRLLERQKPSSSDAPPDAAELDRRAELATHRRELRLAKKELEKLGCIIDETDLTRVYIPGTDGKIDQGFSWHAGENKVRTRGTRNVSEAPTQ